MQDHLFEMLRPGLTVRTYQDGECLIRQGEQSTHLFYIDKGQVEVLLRLPPSREAASPASNQYVPLHVIQYQGVGGCMGVPLQRS